MGNVLHWAIRDRRTGERRAGENMWRIGDRKPDWKDIKGEVIGGEYTGWEGKSTMSYKKIWSIINSFHPKQRHKDKTSNLQGDTTAMMICLNLKKLYFLVPVIQYLWQTLSCNYTKTLFHLCGSFFPYYHWIIHAFGLSFYLFVQYSCKQ